MRLSVWEIRCNDFERFRIHNVVLGFCKFLINKLCLQPAELMSHWKTNDRQQLGPCIVVLCQDVGPNRVNRPLLAASHPLSGHVSGAICGIYHPYFQQCLCLFACQVRLLLMVTLGISFNNTPYKRTVYFDFHFFL